MMLSRIGNQLTTGILRGVYGGCLKSSALSSMNITPKSSTCRLLSIAESLTLRKKDKIETRRLSKNNNNISTRFFYNEVAEITFSDNFNKQIMKNTLPKNLQTIIFGWMFDKEIMKNTLPRRLIRLTFGHCFNQPIWKDTLPPGLEILVFGDSFNQPIMKNTLPQGIQILTFGANFNQLIGENTLPQMLRNLTFDYCFNQPIGKHTLPLYIQTLDFGTSFNQPINKYVLPLGLRRITFGQDFDKLIAEDTIPSSCHLFIHSQYNQTLPSGISAISFWCYTFLAYDICNPEKVLENYIYVIENKVMVGNKYIWKVRIIN
jgi:hypothetical protein